MSREEAIEILQGAIKKPNTKDGYLGQAIDMAIQALSQEPCDDAISREAVQEAFAEYVASGFAESVADFEGYTDIIMTLPSVTQKSKTGHWISNYDEDAKTYWFECDRCHAERAFNTDYCPDCGRRMVATQEREG